MNRRSLLLLAGIAAAGVVVPDLVDQSSGNAQDNTEARLDALETRVSALETKVAVPPTSGQSSSASTSSSKKGGLSFSGAGTMITDPFHLDRGTYVVNMSVKADSDTTDCHVYLKETGKEGYQPLITQQGSWTGRTIIDVHDTGEYRIVSDGEDGARWTVKLNKE